MNFEKRMCDRLGYKYQDIFNHLEFILNNKMNWISNNYGCGLSDNELEMLNDLIFKLQTGKIEIIEFTEPIEKYLDVDEIFKEQQEEIESLKQANKEHQKLNGELRVENERLNNIINKFDKWIDEEYIYDELGMKIFDASRLQDKLQELKGDKSNETNE